MKSHSTTVKTSTRPPADRAARWSSRQFAAATTPPATIAKTGNGSTSEQDRKQEATELSGLDALLLDLP